MWLMTIAPNSIKVVNIRAAIAPMNAVWRAAGVGARLYAMGTAATMDPKNETPIPTAMAIKPGWPAMRYVGTAPTAASAAAPTNDAATSRTNSRLAPLSVCIVIALLNAVDVFMEFVISVLLCFLAQRDRLADEVVHSTD